jgi:tetratricopeptide (TPR) repeat protein
VPFKGNFDQAIANYNQAVQLGLSTSGLFNNRGNAYAGKRYFDQAIVDYNHAIQINPGNPFPFHGRGNANVAIGNFDQAIADYNHAMHKGGTALQRVHYEKPTDSKAPCRLSSGVRQSAPRIATRLRATRDERLP